MSFPAMMQGGKAGNIAQWVLSPGVSLLGKMNPMFDPIGQMTGRYPQPGASTSGSSIMQQSQALYGRRVNPASLTSPQQTATAWNSRLQGQL